MSIEQRITLLGGLKKRGTWTSPDTLTAISFIGGANLDFSEATIPPSGVTITKMSLAGGVKIVVPPNVQVETGGFTLFGGTSIDRPSTTPHTGPTIRVRAYGIFGGVEVREA